MGLPAGSYEVQVTPKDSTIGPEKTVMIHTKDEGNMQDIYLAHPAPAAAQNNNLRKAPLDVAQAYPREPAATFAGVPSKLLGTSKDDAADDVADVDMAKTPPGSQVLGTSKDDATDDVVKIDMTKAPAGSKVLGTSKDDTDSKEPAVSEVADLLCMKHMITCTEEQRKLAAARVRRAQKLQKL